MSYHTIILTGNLGKDPEMRYTPSGQAVTNFSMAVNESYLNNNGERVQKTIWFRITTWGKQAEICNQYLKKGRMVLVEGRLNADPNTGGPRIWQGQNGPAASYEVTASTVRFIGGRGEDGGIDAGGSMGQLPGTVDEDIPF